MRKNYDIVNMGKKPQASKKAYQSLVEQLDQKTVDILDKYKTVKDVIQKTHIAIGREPIFEARNSGTNINLALKSTNGTTTSF